MVKGSLWSIIIKSVLNSLTNKSNWLVKEIIGNVKGACDDAIRAVSLGDQNDGNKQWIKSNCK